jgi:DNA-binding LacI/PurR family transcriptional regulator
VPAPEMGRRAVELAMSIVEGRPVEPVTLLPPHLAVRQSSGPAPA